MNRRRHTVTRATVIRAGYYTTLVSLHDWYDGQILAPVHTWILEGVASKPYQQLPETRLWVVAQLSASTAEELELRAWRLCRHLDVA
jgi:hypothetical protein